MLQLTLVISPQTLLSKTPAPPCPALPCVYLRGEDEPAMRRRASVRRCAVHGGSGRTEPALKGQMALQLGAEGEQAVGEDWGVRG